MLKILQFIVQNGSALLFVILQSVCLYWVVKFNSDQQKIYLYSEQLFVSKIQSKVQDWKSYLNLRKQADSLAKDNARLLAAGMNNQQQKYFYSTDSAAIITDENTWNNYEVIAARVINNSLERRNNMITLNVGANKGIKPGMGVLSSKGVVGIVIDTSEHFALVMSILNQKMKLSSKLKRSGFFGTVVWNGNNPNILQLEAIQKYADVMTGDTVITSGYSIVFPEGLLVGTVDHFKVEGGSFAYTIELKPSQDLANLDVVYVIGHPLKREKEFLENKSLQYE